MKQKLSFFVIAAIAVTLSGCSLSGTGGKTGSLSVAGASGSILKSTDSGSTFASKVKIDDKAVLPAADILTLSFDPNNPSIIYVGTETNGIFRSWDGAEHWERIVFPPERVFGIISDFRNSERLLATGVWKKIGKIYESMDSGKNWKEVYTEPGEGTVVTSIVQSRLDPDIVYAGTSGGVILKSTNGGDTWQNFGLAKGPVTDIHPHATKGDAFIASVFNIGIIRTVDGGKKYLESQASDFPPDPRANNQNATSGGVLTIAPDPIRPETLYAGMQGGMYRTEDYGKTWQNIDIIESSRKYPIRAISVNPTNSNEIAYSAGDTFYRSVDAGKSWMTTRLQSDKAASVIAYDWRNPSVIYIGLRTVK
jgi:photosystem II stability/assembly factor-like uncharacterized protein